MLLKGNVWQANLSLIFKRTIPDWLVTFAYYLRRLRKLLFEGERETETILEVTRRVQTQKLFR